MQFIWSVYFPFDLFYRFLFLFLRSILESTNAVGAMHTVEFVESFSLPNLDCSAAASRQPISYLCSRWSRGHNSFRSSGIVVNWIFLLWDHLWNRPQNVIELILILAIIVSIIIVNRLQSSWYLKGELGNCFKNQILLNFSSCQTLHCRPWTNLCQLLEGWLLLIWHWRVILKFKLFWFSRHYENLHNFIIRRKNEEKLTPWSICRKCLTFLIEPLPPR